MRNKEIDGGKAFDWGMTAAQYAKYRDIYPRELYDRLRALGVAKKGTAWLDLGTGTGILPQNLYNQSATVVGADIAEEQIEFAKEKAKQNGWGIRYLVSPAEKTGLPDDSFDCITAAQCFPYFDRKVMKQEIRRLLKPRGKFIKIWMDWCPDDEIAAKSIATVEAFNPEWNAKAIGIDDMYDDLFDGRVTEEFTSDISFTRDSWHGRMCACRGTLASMSEKQFAAWSEAHTKMLASYPPSFTVKHKVFITVFNV